ncbi:tetratricopeptide repeat protein [Arcticibacter sp. MXS-1]|uniref:tetratricopeptide repeat protein n=1 Tax=Arcticibacter sp. MXS-1 TaxID=3341726 RepID=UPI0035A91C2D
MNTKSLLFALAITGMSISAFAQKSAVNSAKSDYESYSTLRGASPQLAVPKLKSAKESIDKAVLHEKTKADPTAWAYRALIYADLAVADSTSASEQLSAEALTSLNKAKELDNGGTQKENLQRATALLSQGQLVKGKNFYDKQQFAEAYKEFNKGLQYNPGDTTLNYAAAISAMYAKDNAAAIERFKALLPTNYSSLENVYSNLSVLYMQQGDTTNAIKIAGEGAAKFPKSSDLATREIELSLMSGKQKEVITKINEQAAKEPNNKLYPFYLGIAYNAANDNAKAEEAYKKAIALDPNYSDAYINLGGLIMNNGIEIYNKANKLPSNKQAEYASTMKKAQAEFDRALPFLEKSVELNPKSELALKNLKTYYTIKNNKAKIDEIDAKIKAL